MIIKSKKKTIVLHLNVDYLCTNNTSVVSSNNSIHALTCIHMLFKHWKLQTYWKMVIYVI